MTRPPPDPIQARLDERRSRRLKAAERLRLRKLYVRNTALAAVGLGFFAAAVLCLLIAAVHSGGAVWPWMTIAGLCSATAATLYILSTRRPR